MASFEARLKPRQVEPERPEDRRTVARASRIPPQSDQPIETTTPMSLCAAPAFGGALSKVSNRFSGEEVLPQFALDRGIELQPLAAAVAQAEVNERFHVRARRGVDAAFFR